METLRRLLSIPDVRKGLLFMLLCVTFFRIAAHIPLPGLDTSGIAALLAGNQFLGLLNVFSGGTLESFSIVALGVAPYITASIIFQLLGMIFPSVEEMQKEEQGRQRLNRWTRWATLPLAMFQGYGIVTLLGRQGAVTGIPTLLGDPLGFFVMLLSMAAGTVFLMWLGELISEKKIGNGMSIMIFAGIIAGLPAFVGRTASTATSADLVQFLVFGVLTIATVIAVVAISEAQRNIPVQYARGVQGGARIASNLPLRVNMGGMIPILFALSLVVLPPLVAQFFLSARSEILQQIAVTTIELFGQGWFYGLVYFLLVVGFTFFYASIIFRPEQVAENLQKQGGFIPGVRPGVPTAQYLQWVVNRILLLGALFLGVIAILPVIMQEVTGNATLVVGGSSVIIVVSVVVDLVKQVEAQVAMRSYDHEIG